MHRRRLQCEGTLEWTRLSRARMQLKMVVVRLSFFLLRLYESYVCNDDEGSFML